MSVLDNPSVLKMVELISQIHGVLVNHVLDDEKLQLQRIRELMNEFNEDIDKIKTPD